MVNKLILFSFMILGAFSAVNATLSTADPLTIFRVNETVGSMTLVGHMGYPSSDQGCDFLAQPCAPLNDCWGTTAGGKEYAFVGLSNGVDFLDVSDPARPTRTSHSAFLPGCITEWRDIKSHGSTVYVVNDEVAFCTCERQPCQFLLQVSGMQPSLPSSIKGILGKIGAPLPTDGAAVQGRLVNPSPGVNGTLLGCAASDYSSVPADSGDWVALVDRGVCSVAAKVRAAQASGAVGVVIISYRDDEIFPSMSGNATGIAIPVVMIAHSDGATLRSQLASPLLLTASFNSSSYEYDPRFQPPEGLWVIDFGNPAEPILVQRNREWFDAAHNILVDPSRELLYVCGMNTHNGGVLVLGLADPLHPTLVGSWDTAYFHDVEVAFRQDLGKWVLYGTAIYDAKMYMLDVTNPFGSSFLTVLASWDTPDWPHNTASTPDGHTLYVTHEDYSATVTMWDVRSPSSIAPVGSFSIESDSATIPHNIFLKGDRLWASYYASGVAAFDIEKPLQPRLLAVNNSMVDPRYGPSSGYHGVWGIYPFSEHPSGSITYATDIETGFWVLAMVLPTDKPDDQGISGFAVGVIVVLILAILAGTLFVWRYMRNNHSTLSSFHLGGGSSSPWGRRDNEDDAHERLALDDEEEEDAYYNHEI